MFPMLLKLRFKRHLNHNRLVAAVRAWSLPLVEGQQASGPPTPPQSRHPQADRQILIFDSPDMSQQLRATSVWCNYFFVSLWLGSSPPFHSVYLKFLREKKSSVANSSILF